MGGGATGPLPRCTGIVGSMPIGDAIAGAPVAVGRGYITARPVVLDGGGPTTGGGAIIRGGGPLGVVTLGLLTRVVVGACCCVGTMAGGAD